ncbi:MAG: translation initiation factor IF-2 [Deltaproteobacteria bacterium]|nr:translation initiation factor IF-2 [Deltaproteobacteria bacterium]
MGKMRVHELAKKLGLNNQELVDKLTKAGMSVKTHSSTVEETDAMRALQADKPAAKPADAARPRSVVRRAAPTAELPEAAPEPVVPARAPEPEPRVEPKAEPKPEPRVVERAPAALASPAAPEDRPPEPVATAAAAAPTPASTTPAPSAPVAAAPEAAAATGGPQNVVRVIDAEAIKARLAAENRTFQVRRPGLRPGAGRPIREIRVMNDRFGGAPTMVDVSTGAPGRPPGPGGPPGPAGRRDGRGDDRDRRAGGDRGGRDLWLNPGKKKKTGKKGKGPEITQAAAHKRVVEMDGLISVADLAHQMAIKSGQVIQKLFSMGMMVTVNQTIDIDTASIVASEFGFEVKNVAFAETDLIAETTEETVDAQLRPPVVTVMGHVDHGKTSLLDAIRSTNVAAGEAGGITQHIGAYSVDTPRGKVTFLDTPGHAAFTAMRARGAQVTDFVILVVAADDGVMPQTAEAIAHAKQAQVPIIVAINKIDKPEAKPERVMQQLTDHGLVAEEWGGETMMIPVSARKGTGIDKLLESIVLQAEVAELRASPEKRAEGTIIEAELDKGRGPVATILVQTGTLKLGDYIVAGEQAGKVRAMMDSYGKSLSEAGPSTPVQVLGLAGVPDAGDKLNAVADEKTARTVAEHRQQKAREEALRRQNSPMSNLLDFIGKKASDEQQLELRVVVKADVGGSVEAVSQALERLTTQKVKVNVILKGVGTITESDVNQAIASRAMVVGFNSKPDAKAAAHASHEHVEIRTFSIIYEVIDDVRKAMSRLLAPKIDEKYLGRAEVRQLFTAPKLGTIAGSYVTDGKIVRTERVRVKRNGAAVHEGSLAGLKRFKDDVKEVAAGFECGIGFASFPEVQVGDIVECFELVEVAADLGEAIAASEPTKVSGGGAGAGASA